LDPRVARYLRQQIELGGEEIYFDASVPRAAYRVPRDAEPEKVAESAAHAALGARRGEGEEVPMAGERTVGINEPEITVPSPKPDSSATRHGARGTRPGTDWRKDAPPIPGPGLTVQPPEQSLLADEVARLDSLEDVARLIAECRKCALCHGRTHTVPGEGNPAARLLCVGEGPGAKEDETGRPFVGAAGQLLDQILSAIECPRETVFIANIVKCRPPQNRKPLPDEATACLPYLHRQIALVRPRVLLALGSTAAEWLLGVRRSLGELRGKVHRYGGIPLIVTYHPAALLRNPNWKKPTWDDVRIARQLLDQ
jgi:DNA polymerase